MNTNALENIVIDNECKCVIVSESLFTAYAYRVCSSAAEWAEKADYSECLELISQIPTTEVTGLNSSEQSDKYFINNVEIFHQLSNILPNSEHHQPGHQQEDHC